jgi:gas vesicle protein
MTQENRSSSPLGNMLLLFLAGAAAGAVLLALTTPKSGPELRGDLKELARRAKRKSDDLVASASGAFDGLRGRSRQAAGDLEHGMAESMNDLRS